MLDRDMPDGEGDFEGFQQKRLDALAGVVQKLQRDAEDRVSKRGPQEDIWIDDLRDFYQLHPVDVEAQLRQKDRASKSKINMSKAGSKTRAWESRLMDILFPTDDKNWSIEPTPVPQLAKEAASVVDEVLALEARAKAEADAAAEQGAEPMPTPETMSLLEEAATRRAELDAIRKEADDRCALMSTQMEDYLTESNYAAEARDGIEFTCRLGTSISEGPILNDKARRRWGKQVVQDIDPATGATVDREVDALIDDGKPRPRYANVNPWNFFPSNAATCLEDSEGFFIRYPWSDSQLRAFARYPGVNRDHVREMLRTGRKSASPTYLTRLAEIMPEQSVTVPDNVHLVWKYVGPLDMEDLFACALALGDEELIGMVGPNPDPLDELNVIIWFADNRLLKIDLFPLESDEGLFTRWCFEKTPSFWGIGVPFLCRNPNRIRSAAWRMMMDNSEVSSAPQIFIDTRRVKPRDGQYVIRGGKFWEAVSGVAGESFTGKEFYAVNIDSHQAEIASLIQLADLELDELSMLPPLSQGEMGTTIQETAQGMALALNQTNIMIKRVVKNFDDDKTVPEIRKLYDWTMQFGDRPEIKGDYRVNARGSSVLLVREMQARNVLTIALQFGGHAVYGALLKPLEIFREVFRVHQLQPDKFVVSDQEYQAQQANQPEDPMAALEAKKLEIMQLEIESRERVSQLERDGKLQIAELTKETALITAEARFNDNRARDEATAAEKAEDRAAKERSVAAEMGVRASASAPLNDTRIDN